MKNEVNAPLTLTIGVIGIILLLTATVAVDGWYKSVEAEEVAEKWDQSPNTWLHDMRAKQMEGLHDEHKFQRNHYHVSISDAMRIVAKNGGKLTD